MVVNTGILDAEIRTTVHVVLSAHGALHDTCASIIFTQCQLENCKLSLSGAWASSV